MDRKVGRYEKLEKIGEGTYGTVFRGSAPDGSIVALKRIKLDDDEEGVPSSALRDWAPFIQKAKIPLFFLKQKNN